MARTNMDGIGIKRVLEWLLDRDLTELDLAAALGVSESTYNRNKASDNFPSFEELGALGDAFGISPVVLQIAFGLTDARMLPFLNTEEMYQYLRQGGGNHLDPTLALVPKGPYKKATETISATPAMAMGMRGTRSVTQDEVVREDVDEHARAPWLTKPSV